MLVICAVLVPYMSSEFVIAGSAQHKDIVNAEFFKGHKICGFCCKLAERKI